MLGPLLYEFVILLVYLCDKGFVQFGFICVGNLNLFFICVYILKFAVLLLFVKHMI